MDNNSFLDALYGIDNKIKQEAIDEAEKVRQELIAKQKAEEEEKIRLSTPEGRNNLDNIRKKIKEYIEGKRKRGVKADVYTHSLGEHMVSFDEEIMFQGQIRKIFDDLAYKYIKTSEEMLPELQNNWDILLMYVPLISNYMNELCKYRFEILNKFTDLNEDEEKKIADMHITKWRREPDIYSIVEGTVNTIKEQNSKSAKSSTEYNPLYEGHYYSVEQIIDSAIQYRGYTVPMIKNNVNQLAVEMGSSLFADFLSGVSEGIKAKIIDFSANVHYECTIDAIKKCTKLFASWMEEVCNSVLTILCDQNKINVVIPYFSFQYADYIYDVMSSEETKLSLKECRDKIVYLYNLYPYDRHANELLFMYYPETVPDLYKIAEDIHMKSYVMTNSVVLNVIIDKVYRRDFNNFSVTKYDNCIKCLKSYPEEIRELSINRNKIEETMSILIERKNRATREEEFKQNEFLKINKAEKEKALYFVKEKRNGYPNFTYHFRVNYKEIIRNWEGCCFEYDYSKNAYERISKHVLAAKYIYCGEYVLYISRKKEIPLIITDQRMYVDNYIIDIHSIYEIVVYEDMVNGYHKLIRIYKNNNGYIDIETTVSDSYLDYSLHAIKSINKAINFSMPAGYAYKSNQEAYYCTNCGSVSIKKKWYGGRCEKCGSEERKHLYYHKVMGPEEYLNVSDEYVERNLNRFKDEIEWLNWTRTLDSNELMKPQIQIDDFVIKVTEDKIFNFIAYARYESEAWYELCRNDKKSSVTRGINLNSSYNDIIDSFSGIDVYEDKEYDYTCDKLYIWSHDGRKCEETDVLKDCCSRIRYSYNWNSEYIYNITFYFNKNKELCLIGYTKEIKMKMELKEENSSIDKEQCKKCGQMIKINSKFCNYCGEPHNISTNTCPSCGKEINSNFKFCNYCGYKF